MKALRVIAALYLILICNACSENETIDESITNSDKLKIETSIFNTKNSSDNTSFAATAAEGTPVGVILGTDLPLNSTIGVYISSNANQFIQYGNSISSNLLWKNTPNGWMQVDENDLPQYFKLNSSPAYIFGYYPYNSSIMASSTSIPVRAGYTDYMYGKENTQSTNTKKYMVMNHAMSILSFSFTNNGYNGECSLQGIKLKNLPTSGMMNLLTGIITPSGTTGEINLASFEADKNYDPQLPDGSSGFSTQYSFKTQTIGLVNPNGNTYVERLGMFHAIVIPSETPGNYQIDIKVDGKAKTISFSAANNSLKWEAGKRYIYNIAMKSDGTPVITLNAIISDYEDQGNTDEIFSKKLIIKKEDGVDFIERPTWKNEKKYSKSFEVSKTELLNLNWLEAPVRHDNGSSTPSSGCHNYSEDDGKKNWRIPTYKELKAIIEELDDVRTIMPLLGDYWTSDGKASVILDDDEYEATLYRNEAETNKLKVRCIRDTFQPN